MGRLVRYRCDCCQLPRHVSRHVPPRFRRWRKNFANRVMTPVAPRPLINGTTRSRRRAVVSMGGRPEEGRRTPCEEACRPSLVDGPRTPRRQGGGPPRRGTTCRWDSTQWARPWSPGWSNLWTTCALPTRHAMVLLVVVGHLRPPRRGHGRLHPRRQHRRRRSVGILE